jgi:serine/threonine protein kinase
VLVDWGIAGAEFRNQAGTLGYMPPERFSRQKLDHAAAVKGDIFALACVLYEMLVGKALALGPLDDEDARAAPTIGAFQNAAVPSELRFVVIAEAIAKEPHLLASRVRRHFGSTPLGDLLLAMIHPQHEARPSAAQVVSVLTPLVPRQ